MVLDALKTAPWSSGTNLPGLLCHSDAGAQFTSIRYGRSTWVCQDDTENGAVPSIGSVGDSYDNALAGTVNGYYKAELIRGPRHGLWRPQDADSRRPSKMSSSPPLAGARASIGPRATH